MAAPVMLIIRDGWGINPGGKAKAKENGDATLLAHKSQAQKVKELVKRLAEDPKLRKLV